MRYALHYIPLQGSIIRIFGQKQHPFKLLCRRTERSVRTFDNTDIDLMLQKDARTKIYTLTFDYNFTWLEGFGPTVNGKDPALYNKELLLAILSMVSDEPEVVFDRIDLDCFSPASLSGTEWTEIGDCFIKSNGMKVYEYLSYSLEIH